MTVGLNVVLTSAVAQALRAGRRDGAAADVLAVLEGSGVTLDPVFPGADDDALAKHQRIEAGDEDEAQRLQDALLSTPGVEGAYVEPPTELP